MKLSTFKSRRINPLFVWIVALFAIPAFLVLEYALSMFLVLGLCEDCFAKAGTLFCAIFALSNIITVGIIALILANVVIIWNRICVAEYKANTVKVRKINAVQRKRSEARRRENTRFQCTEEWVFV